MRTRPLVGITLLGASLFGLSVAFAQTTKPATKPILPAPSLPAPVKPSELKPPEGVRSGRLQCRGGGAMAVRLLQVGSGADAGKWSMTLDFKGGELRNLKPGECAFDAGPFATNGLFEDTGRLEFVEAMTGAPIRDLQIVGGQVTDFRVFGSEMEPMFNAAIRGTRFYANVTWTGRGGRTMPVIYKVESVNR